MFYHQKSSTYPTPDITVIFGLIILRLTKEEITIRKWWNSGISTSMPSDGNKIHF